MMNADHPEQRLLQTLVPVNALTVDHLNTLLRDQQIEVVCQGQRLFSEGEYDNRHLYLLSGVLEMRSSSGRIESLYADDPACRFPVAHHQPRRCDAVAKSDCSLIRFNSDQLDAMLAWDQASHYIMLDIASHRDLDEDADWMLTLLKSNLFYKVPPMNIRSILNKFEAQYFDAGETVIRQGEKGNCCYFIKEGVAGVYQASNEKASSNLVAELGSGRFFGEDALINETVRNATITMHRNGVLMRLSKSNFFLLIKAPMVKRVDLNTAIKHSAKQSVWLDVRTQDEFEQGHFEDAINMPLNLLKLKSRLLDYAVEYLVYCNSGRRSDAAVHLLKEEGFNVLCLEGGVDAYPSIAQGFFEASDHRDYFIAAEAGNAGQESSVTK